MKGKRKEEMIVYGIEQAPQSWTKKVFRSKKILQSRKVEPSRISWLSMCNL